MTEPTQEEYKALADILGDARGRRVGVSLYGDNLFTAYKALRLAANLPSEGEIYDLISQVDRREYIEGSLQYDLSEKIHERIRSVK